MTVTIPATCPRGGAAVAGMGPVRRRGRRLYRCAWGAARVDRPCRTMISRLTISIALLSCAAARADDSFTGALSPADFQAAGLGKLTPDEIARLNQLVRGQQTGAVAKATAETAQK